MKLKQLKSNVWEKKEATGFHNVHECGGYNQAKSEIEQRLRGLRMDRSIVEALIYDHFPQDDRDFKEYNSEHSQDTLRDMLLEALCSADVWGWNE